MPQSALRRTAPQRYVPTTTRCKKVSNYLRKISGTHGDGGSVSIQGETVRSFLDRKFDSPSFLLIAQFHTLDASNEPFWKSTGNRARIQMEIHAPPLICIQSVRRTVGTSGHMRLTQSALAVLLIHRSGKNKCFNTSKKVPIPLCNKHAGIWNCQDQEACNGHCCDSIHQLEEDMLANQAL